MSERLPLSPAPGLSKPPSPRRLLPVLVAVGAAFALTLLTARAAQAAAAAAPAASSTAPRADLARIQELLDADRPEDALAALQPILAANPRDAGALLLRSTARFVSGDIDAGAADLERAVELDPRLRQGWLNLAGLRMSQRRFDDAYAAMIRARDLAPDAPENELNLGAVELLRGRVAEASGHFDTYLRRNSGSADASYLVATNYAMVGLAALAVQHLATAIDLDERTRLRARSDQNFAAFSGQPAFDRLMATDSWQAPPGSYETRRLYTTRYEDGGLLLQATLDALQLNKIPFDPRVEVTTNWALVWGEMRIKVARSAEGSVVELSAPASRFTPAEWQERSGRLLHEIATRLAVRSVSQP